MPATDEKATLRLAISAKLVRDAANPLGRTAVVKLMYFMQVLRNVPLGYNFRIYTYGPYDGQVLEDLKMAELNGVVDSAVVVYSSGAGYSITSGKEAGSVLNLSREVLETFSSDISTIISEFAARTASDLEMASTIVFVDRLEARSGIKTDVNRVASRVKDMKPRLELDRITHEVEVLRSKGYLVAV